MRYMKRQPCTIASEMLYAAVEGVRKTHFISSCNLSYKVCEKYVAILLRDGLLEKKEDQFYTTEKGVQFIKTCQKLEHLWSIGT